MATVEEVARDFTAMLRTGAFATGGEAFWADDIASVEPADLPTGIPARVSGLVAVRAKARARFGNRHIAELGIDGPFVTGDQFALFLDMLIVDPAGGAAQPFTEIAVFTVRDARIVEERFFYD